MSADASQADATESRAVPRPIVLFDFDGVLVRGDTFGYFLRERIRASRLRRTLALVVAPIGLPLLRTAHGVPIATRLFAAISRIGADPLEYAAQLQEFARQLAQHPQRVIAQGMGALRQAVESGARVVVVSGNIDTLVRDVLDAQGLHHVEVIATRLGSRRHCIGAIKLRALADRGIEPPWDIAYTDSLLDLPMLRGAQRAVMINATEAMVRRAKRALGREVESLSWR